MLNINHKGSLDHQMMSLSWENIEFSVKTKGKEERQVLKGLSGRAEGGELLALMGSSGAGKSSLLNILANRLGTQSSGKGSKVEISGNVFINGVKTSSSLMRKHVAYVMQEDVMMETLTPREMIQFSARLRLPKTMSDDEIEARVEEVIRVLNLNKCADTRVGNAESRGLSGGEKKRTAIGVELVTNPSILFLDEPTSGLDSHTALVVMDTLQELAHRHGRTVICTIHQPSSEIYQLFDKLLLLVDGELIYQGPTHDAVPYFAQIGIECPLYSNPADFFMTVMSSGNHQQLQTIKNHYRQLEHKQDDLDQEFDLKDTNFHRISWIKTMGLLFRRAFLHFIRQDETGKVRFGQTIFMALIVGLLYFQIGDNQSSIGDRSGAAFFMITMNFMNAIMSVITTFPKERTLFMREKANNMYSATQYFWSKIITEVPFQTIFPIIFSVITYFMVGFQEENFAVFLLTSIMIVFAAQAIGLLYASFCKNQEMAIALQPIVIVPFMLFSGVFIDTENVPVYFRWIEAISPFRYGYEALMVNEFTGLTLTCDSDEYVNYGGEDICVITDGAQVLAQSSIDDDRIPYALGILAVEVVVCWILTWINLSMRKKQ